MASEETPSSDSMPHATSGGPLRVLGQYIKDLSFEIPEAPGIFTVMGQQQVGLSVSAGVRTRHVDASIYEVMLDVAITATAGEHTAFLVELHYAAAVAVDESVVQPEQIRPVLHIEVPRLLFPFARQIVCDLCAGSGFPPLMLQMIDFGELYARRYGLQVAPGGSTGPGVEAARTLN